MTSVHPSGGVAKTRMSFLPFWIGTATAVVLVLYGLATTDDPATLIQEGEAVEAASALLWVFASAALIWLAPGVALGRGWHFTVLFLLLGARELDLDKSLLSEGILKARLYSGDAPLTEKLIGLAVVTVILWIVVRIVRHNLRDWLQGLADRTSWAIVALAALGLAVVSKTIDGIARKLEPFGVEVDAQTVFFAEAVEETMELLFVLLVVLTVCLWHRSRVLAG